VAATSVNGLQGMILVSKVVVIYSHATNFY